MLVTLYSWITIGNIERAALNGEGWVVSWLICASEATRSDKQDIVEGWEPAALDSQK